MKKSFTLIFLMGFFLLSFSQKEVTESYPVKAVVLGKTSSIIWS